MCGIAGIYRFDRPVNPEDTGWMVCTLAQLQRRGPDAQGFIQVSDRCILGAARLRITDPDNSNADMPFVDRESGNVIVYNGQIYNHRELREQCSISSFRTMSDTETILQYYQARGVTGIQDFEGMFAFAVWDSQGSFIDIAVDPSRQKPFFYISTPEVFAFSSELETLLNVPGISHSLDPRTVGESIAFRMTIAPDTIWSQIKKAIPGTAMRVKPSGQVSTFRYFHLPLPDPVNEGDSLLAGARHDTEVSCRETITDEHSSAVLLSGGVDSSVVATLLKEGGITPLAVSIGFAGENSKDQMLNEFEYSAAVANTLGLEHLQLEIDANEYQRWFERWLNIAQEPFGSLEAVCIHRIFDELNNRGVKLAYTGTGPDEMLDGYRLGTLISQSVTSDDLPAMFVERFSLRGMVSLDLLMGDALPQSRELILNKLNSILEPYDSCGLSMSEQVQIINTNVHLAEYEHRQMDFLSMHYGIETRNPLCSRRLMERWFSATDVNRTCTVEEKFLWKLVAEKYVGSDIAWRKKKGFPVPDYVKSGPLFERLIEELLCSGSPLSGTGVINIDYLRQIASNEGDEYRRIFFRLILLNRIVGRQLRQQGVPAGKFDPEGEKRFSIDTVELSTGAKYTVFRAVSTEQKMRPGVDKSMLHTLSA